MGRFPAALATRVVTDEARNGRERGQLRSARLSAAAIMRLSGWNKEKSPRRTRLKINNIAMFPTELTVLTLLEQAVFKTIPVWSP